MNPLSTIIPSVVEGNGGFERSYDIYSLLLKERIVFVGSQIDSQIANLVVAELLYLSREDPDRDIQMYIQSPGGSVYAGLAIYDTMQMIPNRINTVACGFTASFGTVLLTAGAKGHRFALPNATIHMHQPLGGAEGQASDIEIQAKEIMRLKKDLMNILSYHTGQPYEKVAADTERDNWMSAEEALEYGLVDKIISERSN